MAYDINVTFRRAAEWVPKEDVDLVPRNTRGIYVLLKKTLAEKGDRYDVVYVGMASKPKAGIRGRLRSHRASRTKGPLWTHFSVYEVHGAIHEEQVELLEGFVRHIYRKDSYANKINKARMFRKIKLVTKELSKWQQEENEQA